MPLQIFLGSSADENTLSLLKPYGPALAPRVDPESIIQDSAILRIPDELLVTILESVAFITDFRVDYSTVKGLALVCRRFHSLIRPLLYNNIAFSARKPVRNRKVFERLEKDPLIWEHFRVLSLYVGDTVARKKEIDYWYTNRILYRLTKLRSLNIHGGFEAPQNQFTWTFISQAASPIRGLAHLRLSRESWGLCLKNVFEHLGVISLKKLELDGVSEPRDGASLLEDEVRFSAWFLSQLQVTVRSSL